MLTKRKKSLLEIPGCIPVILGGGSKELSRPRDHFVISLSSNLGVTLFLAFIPPKTVFLSYDPE